MSQQPQNVTQTTKTELTEDQKRLMGLAMPQLTQFANNPPQLPNFSRVQGFDPLQSQGQQMALGATGAQAGLAASGAQGQNFLSSGQALDPASNPALRGTIDAATRPIQQNLVDSTLPAIRSEFTGAGQYGGSRQGIAEGLASRGASQTMGDVSSKVASDAYSQGLDAMTRSLGLLPSTINSQLSPAATTSAVGDVRQGLGQAQLSEKGSDYSYNQNLPFLVGSDLVSLVNGIPGAATTTTGNGPQQNWMNTALGGLSLATGLFGGGGAGAAGLLPALFAL